MTATLGNNPYIKRDANNNTIQDSSLDTTFRGDYTGTNLIYKGFARPGSATSAAVWQIAKMSYDGSNNMLDIKYPQNSQSHASSEYQFIWDDRATYTYS